jgi:glutamyl-tRNA synthetase
LRKLTNEQILSLLKEDVLKSEFSGLQLTDEYLLQIIFSMKERVSFVKEFITACPYFYKQPDEYEQKSVEKNWKPETSSQMKILNQTFSKLNNPSKEDYENALSKTAEELNVGKVN